MRGCPIPTQYAKARLPEGMTLEQVLQQQLAVLVLSAKTEDALRQAFPLLADVRPHALMQFHNHELSLLVFKTDLAQVEKTLNRLANSNKTLGLKIAKGSAPSVMIKLSTCLSWMLKSNALHLHGFAGMVGQEFWTNLKARHAYPGQ